MDITYSIDLYDKDGDVYETGVYLSFNDTMIRFKNYNEFSDFVDMLPNMREEILSEFSNERRSFELSTKKITLNKFGKVINSDYYYKSSKDI